jgi:2'-5' RNA ligase
MPLAIELALDPESAGPVRALWRRLADAGIRFMAESGADPHVSLAIWQELDVERAALMVAALAVETTPVPLTFTEIRAFDTEVVYLAPAPSVRLGDLQARVQARIGPLGSGGWPHYAPAAWVPHCTLAMDLTPTMAADALAVAPTLALPLHGRLDRIAIVEFRPVRERFSRPLTGC